MMSPMALRRTMSRRLNWGAAAAATESVIIFIFVAVVVVVVVVVVAAAIGTASRLSRLQPRARTQDLGGRVMLRIPDDCNPAATSFDFVALGNTVHAVVGSLGVNVRTDFADDGAHV